MEWLRAGGPCVVARRLCPCTICTRNYRIVNIVNMTRVKQSLNLDEIRNQVQEPKVVILEVGGPG